MLPTSQLVGIPEKKPKFGLETGLGARVQHFTLGRGSSSALTLLQFPSREFSEGKLGVGVKHK